MSHELTNQAPAPANAASKRRGVVLVAVLIVVATLSLGAYHYSDMMTAEHKASEYSHRNVQARAFAESGIHYAAFKLCTPDGLGNDLTALQSVAVGADKTKGYFSLPALPDDECGKINVNAVMRLDSTGQVLHDMLLKLPNMTEEIANSIVAWLGGSVGLSNGGAGNDHYLSLPQDQRYRLKGGPIDSIDELLLVRGVTRKLLYGADLNRNGVQDADEEAGADGFDRGWSAYLTVHSREQNVGLGGAPVIWLNEPNVLDLKPLYDLLVTAVGDDLAKFIVLCRRYGYQRSGTPTGGNISQGDLSSYTLTPRDLTTLGGAGLIKKQNHFELVDAYVSIRPQGSNKTVIFYSPLKDPATRTELLPKLMALTTLQDPNPDPLNLLDPKAEIIPRININTAPKAVLLALTRDFQGQPLLDTSDVDRIVEFRATLDLKSPLAQSPAWLLDAQVSKAKLVGATGENGEELMKYITTRSQVYRVQSVGHFENKGPMVRLEAVIDTNMTANGYRPRILAWRDLSELGKGLPEKTP